MWLGLQKRSSFSSCSVPADCRVTGGPGVCTGCDRRLDWVLDDPSPMGQDKRVPFRYRLGHFGDSVSVDHTMDTSARWSTLDEQFVIAKAGDADKNYVICQKDCNLKGWFFVLRFRQQSAATYFPPFS